ncbi:MAG: uracil-DNA glycosylase [SAR202 cluster bacterium]|nr:uracil-DNA glycosylase [SAR202 cluster bacterium]
MNNLAEVASRVSVCTDCILSKQRTLAVPGEGAGNASVMFIGEGPGFHEDRQGRPFVGPAGKFLSELLDSVGMKREDVFITNVVKCRPPGNRDPLPGEIQACKKYLDKQLELIKPKVVVTLGRHSMGRYMPGQTITKVHGKPKRVDDVMVYPLYHPAAALHNVSLKSVIEEDFKAVPGLLKEAAKETAKPAAKTEEQSSKQLNLFS